MNPLFVVPLVTYTLVATLLPAQVDGRRRGGVLLAAELGIVIVALVAGTYLAKLVEPNATGAWWGKAGLYLTVYLYVCGRGTTLVRALLELPGLQLRRVEERSAGAVGIARGRVVGILERWLALTLILFGEYAAMGFILAPKALVRFRSLDDPERAEYFLIGTLASISLAVLGAVGLHVLLNGQP